MTAIERPSRAPLWSLRHCPSAGQTTIDRLHDTASVSAGGHSPGRSAGLWRWKRRTCGDGEGLPRMVRGGHGSTRPQARGRGREGFASGQRRPWTRTAAMNGGAATEGETSGDEGRGRRQWRARPGRGRGGGECARASSTRRRECAAAVSTRRQCDDGGCSVAGMAARQRQRAHCGVTWPRGWSWPRGWTWPRCREAGRPHRSRRTELRRQRLQRAEWRRQR